MKSFAVPLLLLTFFASQAFSDEVSSIHVRLSPDAGPVVHRIARVFADQVTRRCSAKLVTDGNADLVVELSLDPAIGKEGYRIADGAKGTIHVIGQGDRGLLYGVGKFLRTSQYERGSFIPSAWRGRSAPALPVRGVYFATHFHNFYHDAPIDEVRQYVEELGLWGANLLVVWYDMHHFHGFDDPKAKEFRQRLYAISNAAKRIGLGVGFGVIANEGYADSPAALRAKKEGGKRGGWYDCQICPSTPNGLAYILANCGQEFDWWADLRPEFMWIWPYDQGGCGCSECRPWGSNGYLRTAQQLSRLVRQKLPETQVILSTWFFDETDWQGLTDSLRSDACRHSAASVSAGVPNRRLFLRCQGNRSSPANSNPGRQPDYILADSIGDYPRQALDETARAEVPLLNFPEISMWGRDPWGGYGANPAPSRCMALWAQTEGKLSGGVTYSEGLYEDMNKVIWLQCYWNGHCNAGDTLKEYVGYEYSPAVTEDVMKAVALLETTWPEKHVDVNSLEARELMQRVEAKLTQQAKTAWRWRILLLRTVIDSELHRTRGAFQGSALRQACQELTRIYHAERADAWVRPPAIEEVKH
jgi:hypothetical protein